MRLETLVAAVKSGTHRPDEGGKCPLCGVDPSELVHKGLMDAQFHRAEEYKAQLRDVSQRLLQQRRRLQELEELQAAHA